MNTETRKYPKFLFVLQDVEFPERFNSRQFGPYEHPKTQKLTYLINADGRAIESGYIVNTMNLLFDVSKPNDAQTVHFLMHHPENIENGGTAFTLKDIEKEAESVDDDLINELDLEQKVLALDLRKLKAVASSLRINYNLPKKSLQAQVVRRIRTPQPIGEKTEPGYISVSRIVEAKKTLRLLDIRQMVDNGIIKINTSGIYFHGQHNLGLNEDQVIVYFDREPTVFSMLKSDLRNILLEKGEIDDGKEDDLDLKL